MVNNEFIKVNFNVYVDRELGGVNPKAFDKFFLEILDMFTPIGFIQKQHLWHIGVADLRPELYKGDEGLYIDTVGINGYLKKDSIEPITHLLSSGKTFDLKAANTYETVLKLTDSEFLNMIEKNRSTYIRELLNLLKTDNRNVYKHKSILDCIVSGIYTLPDRCWYSSMHKEDLFKAWLETELEKLITKGEGLT